MAPAGRLSLRGVLPTVPSALEASGLFARDDEAKPSKVKPHGVLDPHDINNAGFFVLFALIGVAFVITGIWFFFWAKNGGFYFKDNDWDDYKSTVLRRKGPNGTILSGATPTTDLGGGSVYKDVGEDDGTTVVTESTALSGVTAGASDVVAREKRKHKQARRERERERERRKRRGDKKQREGRHVGEDGGVMDEKAEKEAQKQLRSYRHEKPARVGGLNKQSEGSNWDGSTNATESTAASSDLLSNRQSTPTRSTQQPQPAIRKVYSTTTVPSERETERIRSEARRLREESRTARRDFSYQRPGGAESALSESLLEGSGGGSELGTKSYHHPMPELREHEGGSGGGGKDAGRDKERERERRREREERGARGGYRRGGGDEEV
ncbi:hypothetical protein HRG_009874 [Hirsutella rhossiliensis]|uniref:Endosomal spry domain-containing protein n=1 Tax=Hirsutella rhossiliensis TaxID=111463 RepID=A0A9P8MQW5_9HYPO|nr:uncharacterized protein HRG_09874 [Hirsutella rhossiliensis]KAH0958829.1 hypothetical protein HRG_09874 [Hirsutella rhossiliensis]